MSNAAVTSNSIEQALTPQLKAYYANRRLMWRNLTLIALLNMGWGIVYTVIGPMMAFRLLDVGVAENTQATINSANGWAVSFLVMWFSWMSDHTVNKIGRRKPYVFISAPFIVMSVIVFPFVAHPGMFWVIIGVLAVSKIAGDLKDSTFPLLNIDCIERSMLARANSVFTVVGGIIAFAAMRGAGYVVQEVDAGRIAPWAPYVFGGAFMTITTSLAWFIKEPVIHNPATEKFKPWSTFKVAARDKRIFILMLGVAMVISYQHTSEQWTWFWARDNLHIEKKDIFNALSWAGLINIALAYPTGWLIDRWGGLQVTIIYVLCSITCFVLAVVAHDINSLILLSIGTTITFPLYLAADIMVYKNAEPKDVGSITSTNACIRNAYRATLGLVTGWSIFWSGHKYFIGFSIGIVMTLVGLVCLLIYFSMMRWGTRPQVVEEVAEMEAAEVIGQGSNA